MRKPELAVTRSRNNDYLKPVINGFVAWDIHESNWTDDVANALLNAFRPGPVCRLSSALRRFPTGPVAPGGGVGG